MITYHHLNFEFGEHCYPALVQLELKIIKLTTKSKNLINNICMNACMQLLYHGSDVA